MDEKHLADIIAKAVSAGVDDGIQKAVGAIAPGCCAAHCKEKCGFTPAEHAIKHQRSDELVNAVDATRDSIKGTIAKVITVFLIGAVGIGVVYSVYEITQKFLKAVGR